MTINCYMLINLVFSFCCVTNYNGEIVYLINDYSDSKLPSKWINIPKYLKYNCVDKWNLDYFEYCFVGNSLYPENYCVLESSIQNLSNVSNVFINITIKTKTCQYRKIKELNCSNFLNLSISNGENEIMQVSLPGITVPVEYQDQYWLSNDLIVSDVINKSTIQLKFISHNYCGVLLNVSVFYYKCPNKTIQLVNFPNSPAPSLNNSPFKIKGVCSKNAVTYGTINPYMNCYSNGSYILFGECWCKEGYEKNDLDCEACKDGYFKNKVGNNICEKCSLNSKSVLGTSCICNEGFYRFQGNENNSAAICYKAPSRVQNVTVHNITVQSATLSWMIPTDHFVDYFYINCTNCPSQNFTLRHTLQTCIFIDGLDSYTKYNVVIESRNNVSALIGKVISTYVQFKTKIKAPGSVQDVVTNVNSDRSVTIIWKSPHWKGDKKLKYKVKYNGNEFIISETHYTISSSSTDKSFTVEIAGYFIDDDGNQLNGFVYKKLIFLKGQSKLSAVFGTVGGVIGLIAIVMVVVLIVWRKKHPLYLQAVRMEDGTVRIEGNHFLNRGRLYIDPNTYDCVDDAVQEFANELDNKNLEVGNFLGGGEFADVYKGTLLKNEKRIDVAIKMLKHGASKHDRDDFLGEAAILGQFTDYNVILLQGVVFKEKPNLIVLEFMANGSLDKFLQKNDMQFSILQLLGMARGVASGMKCLSEMGFIHRDLAARNILVDESFCCKVADFGMSRKINVDDTYDTKGGKVPVRWTAPESIQFKKFTSASDMWSYGVLLWEIMSYGERPYWDWGNYEVVERVNTGYRLPPPMGCPKVVHNLMLECWNKDRSMRPRFSGVVSMLESWIRAPNLLSEKALSVVQKNDEKLDYTILQSITKWLEAIGMEKYANNFLEKGFATPRQILNVSFEDLLKLEIEPIGHRKKIYKAIQNTKVQIEAVKVNKYALVN
uniref:receptor protein-tyrosine kinase n=1 Tax=Hydra vulgaris TaxID=6087 RepID=T2MEM7_HYDVU